jgi:hypothetical protein
MSANWKKSMGWMVVLMLCGVAALFGGAKSLVVLVPAAALIWFGAGPMVKSGRN